MDEVKAKILAVLDANGGSTDWNTVKAALDYREQRMMPNALRALKADGIAQKQNRWNKDTKQVEFRVFRIQGGK